MTTSTRTAGTTSASTPAGPPDGSGRQPRPGTTTCHRRLMSVVVVGVAAVVLAGCTSAPERADTVQSAAPTATSSTASEREASDAGRGTLTTAQALAALLTIQDMPTGWSVESPASDTMTSTDEETPTPTGSAGCDAVLGILFSTADSVVASARVSYSSGADVGVIEVVEFYDVPTADVLEDLGDLVSTCSSFTIDGETLTVSALSFPDLGERTLALRLSRSSLGGDSTLDAVLIAEGHNMVSFAGGGSAPVTGAELQAIAEKGLDRYEDVSS